MHERHLPRYCSAVESPSKVFKLGSGLDKVALIEVEARGGRAAGT